VESEKDDQLTPVDGAGLPPARGGTRLKRLALELLAASAVQAALRVQDGFTLLRFLDKLAQGVVVGAILLPIALSVMEIVDDLRAARSSRRSE